MAPQEDFISRFFQRFPWLLYLFLDNAIFRNSWFRKIILYRPRLFEFYYRWKPLFFPSKAILIIKTDAIGDYVLFRHALQSIRKSKKFKGYQIFLLGNEVWKDLAINQDSEWVDGFFWLNRAELKNPADSFYRQRIVFELNIRRFHSLLYFSFSRESLPGDWLAAHISAKNKISTEGDLLCQTARERREGNLLYTSLFPLPVNVHFELFKNKALVEWLLEEKIAGEFIALDKQLLPKVPENQEFVVFFPGANADFRQWPLGNFEALGRKWMEEKGMDIVVAGGPEDVEKGDWLLTRWNSQKAKSVCGKLDLASFAALLSRAACLVSNETGAVHLAVSLGIPTLCLSNGNHYGRFNPYENYGFEGVKTIYPESIRQKTEAERLALLKDGSEIPISKISVEEVPF